MSMGQFVESVRSRGRVGLVQDYTEIRARPPDGSFNHARYIKKKLSTTDYCMSVTLHHVESYTTCYV